MQKYSYHSHTNSLGIFDGHNTAAEMIKAAQEHGYEELGISNHLIFHPNANLDSNMDFNDYNKALDVYKKVFAEIREASINSEIKVYAGFEVDFFPSLEWRNLFEKMMSELKPDYLIGSTHYIRTKDETKLYNLYMLDSYGLSHYDCNHLLHNYWQNIIESIKSGYFDFIAHLDVCKLRNFGYEPEWDDYKWEIIETLAANKQAYELNTSGWSKVQEQHPYIWMIEELNKRNVPIVISDDAHCLKHIGQHYEQAENLLQNMHYTNRFHLG